MEEITKDTIDLTVNIWYESDSVSICDKHNRKIYEEKLTLIRIKPSISVLGRNMELNECRLQGITFYCREPERVRIEFKNRFMAICCNPPDHTGRASVSVPWTRLEYPDI